MSNKKQDAGPHKKSPNPETSHSVVSKDDDSAETQHSHKSQGPRPVSPVPSNMSLRSDRSKLGPPNFSSDTTHSDPESQGPRPVSPVPSHMSLRSDRSKLGPPNFSSDATHSDPKLQPRRPVSPVPSNLSMHSDTSKLGPPNFSSDETRQSRKRTSPHRVKLEDFQEVPIKRSRTNNEVLSRVIEHHKVILKRRFENISEGIIKSETQTLLNKIYTELHITEGESEGVNKEHEVWQVESASRAQTTEDTPINCNDIFKSLPGQEKHIRTVMTKGVAGIGKTVSVQKFILDWIDGVANQDVHFMFPLPFRELNLVSGGQYSLHKLLLDFHPELKELKDDEYKDCQAVFIFDGLDESRISLHFQPKLLVPDLKQKSSVDILITNLIQENLFPSARIWITSRPAAASQIPSQYIDQITEIRGFSDPQKEEYFRKRISNESQANIIISHIRSSRSLHIMCHIPVFCWIAATVLQEMLEQDNSQEIPKTLTEMFIHFLLIQTTRKNQKYQAKSDQEMQNTLASQKELILKLSELAFRHLERENFLFLEEEVKECDIDVTDALVHSGLCTDVFKEETVLFGKLYAFVHLTIQEFLAALYTFASYIDKKEEVLKLFLKEKSSILPEVMSLDELLKNAVNRALESKTGHLDLFVRFLHGISMESNQKLLQGLLKHTENNPEIIEKAIKNLKELNRPNISPDRWINLLHCLVEMHDSSVHEEVLAYMKSAETETPKLKLAHCSAVAKILQMAEKPVEELDLMKYKTSDEGRRRLIPAVRNCRKALLADCKLTEKSCEVVASALESTQSHLTVLDLSNNDLHKSEDRLLKGLQSPLCKLESLRLAHCKLSVKSCEVLASVLQSSTSALTELDLSGNDLQDSVAAIFHAIMRTNSKLRSLRLAGCKITEASLQVETSVVIQPPLIELDLSRNPLKDSGVKKLLGLKSLHHSLRDLRLSGCSISRQGCEDLASALEGKTFRLTELHLKDNNLEEKDVRPLSKIKEDPNFVLKTFEYS